MCHTFFIHSSTAGHVGCFQICAIAIKCSFLKVCCFPTQLKLYWKSKIRTKQQMLRLIWKIEVSDQWGKKDRPPMGLHSGQESVSHDEGGADVNPVRKEGSWWEKKKKHADGKSSLLQKELKTSKKPNQRLGRDRCKTFSEKLKLLRKILEFFRAKSSFKATPNQHVLRVNKQDLRGLDGLQGHPANTAGSRSVPKPLTYWCPI